MPAVFFCGADAKTVDSVTGVVTDLNCNPLPGATVSLVDGSYLEIASTSTDSDGLFTFRGADDRGTGSVKAIASYTVDGKTYNLTKTPATWYSTNLSVIRINTNETCLADYPFQPGSNSPAQVFNVTGQVTDANDRPLPEAEVHLYDGHLREIGVTLTDERGNFTFTHAEAASPGCKVEVFYRPGDKVYRTYLQNAMWYPTDTGAVTVNKGDTMLFDYPEPTTGFVWGVIQENTTYRALSGDVILTSGKKQYSIKTSESKTFFAEVPVGEYTIYAVHNGENGSLESRPAPITVSPSRNYLDQCSISLVLDPVAPPEDLKASALLLSVVIGAILLAGLWLGARRL